MRKLSLSQNVAYCAGFAEKIKSQLAIHGFPTDTAAQAYLVRSIIMMKRDIRLVRVALAFSAGLQNMMRRVIRLGRVDQASLAT